MPENSVQTDPIGADSFARLIEIGIALSAEHNHDRLMENILMEAKDLCNADGGTLYLRNEDNGLKFEIMRTDSLNIAMGGTTGKDIPFPPLQMYDTKTGAPNEKNIASYAAVTGETVNIKDAYKTRRFDFTGTKKFDQGTGYRSKSFLTVPLKNHDGEVIGVIQLLNAQDPKTGEVIAFSDSIQPLIRALVSQAAVALDNQLLLEAQKKLLDSFIELIASAIDAKSPYTGGHCQRVPELTKMLAAAACDSDADPFKEFDMDEDETYELHIAAWLHDCGKVTTPEYVVDKATKLETIFDRIHEIRMRFEVLKRDAEIDYLKARLEGKEDEATLKKSYEEKLAQIDDDFDFIATSNVGGEFMAPELVDRVKQIADIEWTRTLDDRKGVGYEELKRMERAPAKALPVTERLLADKEEHIFDRDPSTVMGPDNPYGFKLETPEHLFNKGEIYNLTIGRGTLTNEDRFKINEHMVQTIVMLEHLPFPKNLARVPEYAGGHHETLIGTGYPKKLSKEDMTIPARAMAIADIFEALTAADRPYKMPKKLSDSIKIMSFMKKDQHIDEDLFKLFLTSGVYKDYAKMYLLPEQLDEVDIEQYLS
ncbi:MAG: GAF domain-containing protein [Rhodospirillaceae bacterium]|jgi:HD-GYP domain-containing protein (c-di-GMP phosphodiesterase class II)|nr:GAF domain-containing protein [Rhodospirillales bacterium]MBT3905339.1 GAF domain-containing protein [Rhodospirillaceae bacterium]MBT4702403.1 GAF domain-containing protein [Rhodospirillaceae bacterium]MBT5035633.1 GAF domain-containing protein [Rhodospirillaceae bacterium]MBT6219383.1 GAF domain-containing protein [Rhodospirillaceae bacterium]